MAPRNLSLIDQAPGQNSSSSGTSVPRRPPPPPRASNVADAQPLTHAVEGVVYCSSKLASAEETAHSKAPYPVEEERYSSSPTVAKDHNPLRDGLPIPIHEKQQDSKSAKDTTPFINLSLKLGPDRLRAVLRDGKLVSWNLLPNAFYLPVNKNSSDYGAASLAHYQSPTGPTRLLTPKPREDKTAALPLPLRKGPPGPPQPASPNPTAAMNRPRTGRSTATRDGVRDSGESELEAVKARVREGLLEVQKHQDRCRELGAQIVALEEEIKSKGSRPSSTELDRLDTLYRENYKNSEAEQAVLNEEPYELKNQMAIMQALAATRTNEEAQPRNGAVPKSRKLQRQGGDSDTVADSPGPSPSDSRKDGLKRVKGATQRSSSVPSSGARAGAGGKSDDDGALHKGVRAERDGQFVVGAEVFYRHPKGALNVEGEGIQCIIKKVWLEKKPIAYDVQDPEPDDAGRQDLHKATATDLIPIPKTGSHLPTFGVGKHVLARYPDTTTFYPAEVMSFRKDTYNLKFEGEEDDKEMEVDKRFVLDLRVK